MKMSKAEDTKKERNKQRNKESNRERKSLNFNNQPWRTRGVVLAFRHRAPQEENLVRNELLILAKDARFFSDYLATLSTTYITHRRTRRKDYHVSYV
jgi:hypothetical protein